MTKLHAELRSNVIETSIGLFIAHPLVHTIFFDEPRAIDMFNQMLEQKKKYLQKLRDKKRLSPIIFLYERPYRFEKLLEERNKVDASPEDFWDTAREVWTDSENINQNIDGWKELFAEAWSGEGRRLFHTDEDWEFLQSQPEEFEVFQGSNDHHEEEFSWTIDKKVAIFFAKRFDADNPEIDTRMVRRDEVFAYVSSRGESEIIILNRDLL